MPTEVLRRRLLESRLCREAVGVHTDNRRKEAGFGLLKMLLQRGDLALPVHPPLLSQLAALEFETLDSGQVRIAVPERRGHDDLAMALMLALSPEVAAAQAWRGGGQLVVGHYRIGDRDRGTVSKTTWKMPSAETAARLAGARTRVRAMSAEHRMGLSGAAVEQRARRMIGLPGPRSALEGRR